MTVFGTCSVGELAPTKRYSSWRKRIKFLAAERGQSLLEFAAVLPLLALLAFGVTEFGRAFYQYNTLSKAIRDGGRYMISHIYSTAEMDNAKNMVVYGNTRGSGMPVLPGLTIAKIQVIPDGGTTPYSELNPPGWVTIRINGYPFNSLVPGLINLNVNFSPQFRMRYLGPNATY